MKSKIAIIGLGYVCLPVAVAFAEKFPGMIGFDIDSRRIAGLRKAQDWTGEIGAARLKSCGLTARRVVRFMAAGNRAIHKSKVGILGLTFKENVPDIRNSRVPDILAELRSFGIKPILHDPLADPRQVKQEYGITVSPLAKFQNLDALILAVPHAQYRKRAMDLPGMLRKGGILADIKSVVDRTLLPGDVRYWSL